MTPTEEGFSWAVETEDAKYYNRHSSGSKRKRGCDLERHPKDKAYGIKPVTETVPQA